MALNSSYAWSKSLRFFLRASIALSLLVILAGSIVRMTGSGMGCPDWPRCYGLTIPPTSPEQVYWSAGKEYAKNQMVLFEGALWSAKEDHKSPFIFSSLAWEKYTQHDYAEFNATHTWIEFINRLSGALLGVPVLLAFLWSLRRAKTHPRWALSMTLGLLLLLFEAWLGKVVVDGHLVPHHITYHMIGALGLLIVFTAVHRSVSFEREERLTTREGSIHGEKYRRVAFGFGLFTALLLLQMVLGTQVREWVDAHRASPHFSIQDAGVFVYIHRSASLLVLALAYWIFSQTKGVSDVHTQSVKILAVLLLETLVGVFLFYGGMPVFLQPIHLFLSALVLVWAVDGGVKSLLIYRATPTTPSGE